MAYQKPVTHSYLHLQMNEKRISNFRAIIEKNMLFEEIYISVYHQKVKDFNASNSNSELNARNSWNWGSVLYQQKKWLYF